MEAASEEVVERRVPPGAGCFRQMRVPRALMDGGALGVWACLAGLNPLADPALVGSLARSRPGCCGGIVLVTAAGNLYLHAPGLRLSGALAATFLVQAIASQKWRRVLVYFPGRHRGERADRGGDYG